MIELEDRNVRISVRELVEFILRSGDIDTRITGDARREAMLEGGRIHRKIQRMQGPDYQAEVALRHETELEGFRVTVFGRADGVIRGDGGVTVDEIKGVYRNVLAMEKPVPVHLAQAMCYGHFLCVRDQLPGVAVRMTYCNLEREEEIRYFEEEFTAPELDAWFADILAGLSRWIAWLYGARQELRGSAGNLEFPFPYRKGQRELARAVYLTEKRENNIFMQAPTGIGKTMAAVFPSVRAVGEGLAGRLFYLTAKTTTRKTAEEALSILRARGLHFRAVTLTAREKICVLEETACNPEACPRAAGHFDRVNDAVYDVITHEEAIGRETVLAYAEKHNVCPFELSLDIADFMDGIICDYNYAFDPDASLSRCFGEGKKGDCIFLVDEAHNLVPRAREMYSAAIVKEEGLLAKKILAGTRSKPLKQLDALNRRLLAMKKALAGDYEVYPDVDELAMIVQRTCGALEEYLDEHRDFEGREDVLGFWFSLRSFLNILDLSDENYRFYGEMREDGRFAVRLFCVNPAVNLGSRLEQAKSTVFFSATLLPLSYYRSLLCPDERCYNIYAESPFPRENRIILAAGDVTSRYRSRGEDVYRRIREYIRAVVLAKTGNYMIFFPSYAFLSDVFSGIGEDPGYDILVQDRVMTDAAREAFLAEFEKKRERPFAAFCVMGGVFSEGIDLTSERLIGVIIVGTGFPMVCTEQKILQDYFDERDHAGFSYAYQYPGMTKVLQAAGRVIRTPEDRGVILLLDERFLWRSTRSLFPREWEDVQAVTLSDIEDKLRTFWEDRENG